MKNFVCTLLLASLFVLSFPDKGNAGIDFGFAREDGGNAGAYLSFGAGVRSLGMGKAFTAVADDASAVYWNSAGLTQLNKQQVTVLHAVLWENTNYDFIAYAYPASFGTLGVGYVCLNSGNFDKRDQFNNPAGEAGVSESCFMFSYGRNIGKLMVGSTAKMVSQKMDTYSGSSLGLDCGILYPLSDAIKVGANLQNIVQPRIRLMQDEDIFPLALHGGMKYTASDNLLFSTDLVQSAGRSLKVHIGAEYSLLRFCALRAGIDETEVTAGFGVHISNFDIGYAFSYHDAINGKSDLGSSHRFGINMVWGR